LVSQDGQLARCAKPTGDRIDRLVHPGVPIVGLVGGGPFSHGLAERLCYTIDVPAQIIHVIGDSQNTAGGVAFGAGSVLSPHWITQLSGVRSDPYRENWGGILHYLNHEADRSLWPEKWQKHGEFEPHHPIWRGMLPPYLRSELEKAKLLKRPGVEYVELNGTAISADEHPSGVVLGLQNVIFDGQHISKLELDLDQLVLLSGFELENPHMPAIGFSKPWFSEAELPTIFDIYSTEGIDALRSIAPDTVLGIIGAGAHAHDIAIEVIKNGHQGKIRMIQTGQTMPIPVLGYAEKYQHNILEIGEIDINELYVDPKGVFGKIVNEERARHQKILDHISQILEMQSLERSMEGLLIDEDKKASRDLSNAEALYNAYDNEMAPESILERVAKAMEPYIGEVFRQLPPEHHADFLRRIRFLDKIRVSINHHIFQPVHAARINGEPQVKVVSTVWSNPIPRPENIDNWLPESEFLPTLDLKNIGYVVDRLKRQSDYSKVLNPIWKYLYHIGAARNHTSSGLGVDVSSDFYIIGENGVPSTRISTAGYTIEGMQRVLGRIGPFARGNLAVAKDSLLRLSILIARKLSASKNTHFSISDSNNTLPVKDAVFLSMWKHVLSETDATKLTHVLKQLTHAYVAFYAKSKLDSKIKKEARDNALKSVIQFSKDVDWKHRNMFDIFNTIDQIALQQATDILTDKSITPKELTLRIKQIIQECIHDNNHT